MKMAGLSNTMKSPVERIKVESTSYIKEEIIISDLSDRSDDDCKAHPNIVPKKFKHKINRQKLLQRQNKVASYFGKYKKIESTPVVETNRCQDTASSIIKTNIVKIDSKCHAKEVMPLDTFDLETKKYQEFSTSIPEDISIEIDPATYIKEDMTSDNSDLSDENEMIGKPDDTLKPEETKKKFSKLKKTLVGIKSNSEMKSKQFVIKCLNCKKTHSKHYSRLIKCDNCSKKSVVSQCLLCHRTYCSISSMYRHFVDHHGQDDELVRACAACEEKFVGMKKYSKHIRNCKENPYLKCEFCTMKFRTIKTVRTHIIRLHPDKVEMSDMARLMNKIAKEGLQVNGKLAMPTKKSKVLTPDLVRTYCAKCNENFPYEQLALKWEETICQHCSSRLLMECAKCRRRYKMPSSMDAHLRVASQCVVRETRRCEAAGCEYASAIPLAMKRHVRRWHTRVERAPEPTRGILKRDKQIETIVLD